VYALSILFDAQKSNNEIYLYLINKIVGVAQFVYVEKDNMLLDI
jgi:hypothetical protein